MSRLPACRTGRPGAASRRGRLTARRRAAARRGFTLAEMIAAIALLAVFSVFIVRLFAASHTLAARTDRIDGAVLCARNLAEAWQAGMDRPPAAAATGVASVALPVGPLAGAGSIRSGQPVRLGFDDSLQPVDAASAQAAYLAELSLTPHPGNQTELLRIVVRDPRGAELFDLTAARLVEPGVTP